MTKQNLRLKNSFLDRARYAKGRRTLQAILDATYELVISGGLAAASQEAIAARAGVTQSAVRHYFPTKDELLLAFFTAGIERLQAMMRLEVERTDDPLRQLLDSAGVHYDRMLEVDNVYFFEVISYAGRNPDAGKIRRDWWRSLNRHYEGLIRRIRPDWDDGRCADAAFQVLTLVLGGWTTLGSSRPVQHHRGRSALRKSLIDGIERLVTCPNL